MSPDISLISVKYIKMANVPNMTAPNGQIIATGGPPLVNGYTQRIEGSPLDAAAAKTLAAQASQVATSRSLGAGQKGSSRRRRRHRGGALNLNASIPSIPEAGTIKGVSHETNHLNAVNNLNQLRADKIYDGLINAPPIRLTGGTKKRSRKTKHGRRRNRTHRGKRNKHSSHRRRTHKRV